MINKIINPLVSVIVPVYNAEKYIEKCIKSILNQSLFDIEIIIINDASLDNSLIICEKLASKDQRIKIFDNTSNKGVAYSRNLGLDNVNGKYIGFVDADDYIDLDMYEQLYRQAIKYDADIVECGFRRIDINDNIIIEKEMKPDILYGEYECSLNHLSHNNAEDFSCNKIYNKELFDSLKYPNYKYSEDYYINVFAHKNCKIKITIKDCYYNYLINDQGACEQPFNISKLDQVKAGISVYKNYDSDHKNLYSFIALYILRYVICCYEELCDGNYNEKELVSKQLCDIFQEYYERLKFKDIRNQGIDKKDILKILIFKFNPKFYLMIRNISKN
ncbi:glycosyltransferase [Clostridium chromiireducens]|uniref:Glycosyltransferase n=1 Tax=Clostridium chromiireducens TaxID=225345 RepID=A0A964RM11_9CLOT|nr:glycosyltransferase family 2 protein [Clostridium chromiireducens]MVX64183.1 glycosyltransferase [Clostridium chromiireducens]